MRVVHVVSVADAQSIPLELALAIGQRLHRTKVVAFYDLGDHPVDHKYNEVMTLGANGPFSIAALLAFRRMMIVEKPDIIHLHHAVSALGCAIVSFTVWPRPKLIKTEHNDHRFLAWYQTVINWLLFPFCGAIICNSDTTLASFGKIERWLAGRRAIRIYNGVDTDRVRRQVRKRSEKSSPVVIGNVARLVPQKNQVGLIKGFAAASSQTDRSIVLEIVGNGPLLEKLKETARHEGVESIVVFSGGVGRDRVYEKMAGWDGFIMASHFEGFCNAVVEAVAAGLPVAVSDIDTLREVADVAAVRFDPDSLASIASAIIELVDVPLQSGDSAKKYDISTSVDNHVALYKSIFSLKSNDNDTMAAAIDRDSYGR